MSRSSHNYARRRWLSLFLIILANISYATIPTTADIPLSVDEDLTLNILDSYFTPHFNDADGHTFNGIRVDDLPGEGKLQLSGSDVSVGQFIPIANLQDGSFKFIPDPNENGDPYTTFPYRVVDSNAEESNPSTITITVNPQDDPPTAQSTTLFPVEDTPLSILPGDFGFNDIDGHAFDRIIIETTVVLGALKNSGVTLGNGAEVSYTVLNSGNLTYTPATNGSGESYAVFSFRVVDETDAQSTLETITFDVTPVNDLPTSLPQEINIVEDGSKVFSGSDFPITDADGDGLASIRVSSLNITGSLKLNDVDVSNGQTIASSDIPNLEFTPISNGFGDDYATFQFEVNDGTAFSASTYLYTINVTAIDDPPTIGTITDPDDIYEDAGQQEITVTGISAGGGEAALTINDISVSTTVNPALIANPIVFSFNSGTGEAVIRYTPLSDQYGSSTLTVTVDDGNSTVSDDFVVDVISINDEPTIDGISDQSTNEDTPIEIDITSISAGASNESGQFLTITATSEDTNIVPNGIVTYTQGNSAGTILFTPAENAVGTVEITVTVNDGVTNTNPGDDNAVETKFNLTVNAVNDPPTLADITSPGAVDEDATLQSVGLSGIGDGDPELTQVLTISAESKNTALVETFDISTSGTTATLKYTPKSNAYGTAEVEVTVLDDGGESVKKSFTVTVNPVNDPPTIDSVTGIIAIDEDASEQTIILSGISPGPNEPSQTVTISASSDKKTIIPDPVASYNGSTEKWEIKYTPAPDQYGSVYITITVEDDDTNKQSTTTTFLQVVNPINDPPTLNSIGNVSIDEDSNSHNIVFDGITDDGEVPKNLSVTATSDNTDIISSITVNYTSANTSGSIDFEANPNRYTSADPVTITVRVTDKDLLFTEQSFEVDIANINDPPTLSNIPTPSAVLEDATPPAIVLTGISAGPFESESITADVSADDESLFQVLTVSLNGDGTADLDYTPALNANGSTTVYVTIDDGPSSITKSVDITILPVNDIPGFDIPAYAASSENEGQQVVSPFATNIVDGDPEDQVLSFTTLLGIPTGNLTFITNPTIDVATGDLTYEASPDANGSVSVTVTLQDNGGTGNGGIDQISKSFDIVVTAVNKPPTLLLNGDPPTINEDAGAITETAFAQSIDDGDPEVSQTMQFDITQASGSLTFSSLPSINATTGDLTYQAADNANGTADFNVTLRETVSGLTSDPVLFTISVNAINDPPTGDNSSITINEDATHLFQSSDFIFSDIDNNVEGIQLTVLPLKGDLLYNGSAVALGTSYPDITLLSYTPASNENGTSYATFSFKFRDESGDLSVDPYTMTINVDAISDDPTGASSSVNTEEDTNYSFIVGNFPFSDSDDDAFNGIIIQSNVAKGTLLNNTVAISSFPATVSDVTQLVYQPLAGESGTPYTSFTFDVIDGSTATSESDSNSPYIMSINVGAVSDPPTAADESITMLEDQTYSFSASDFPSFSDPDGDTFAGIQITQIETSGTLKYDNVDVVALTNYPNISLLTYTPPSNQNGPALANFKFRVIDSSTELNISTEAPYTMTIDVTAVNDVPIFTISGAPPTINEDAGTQTIAGFASSIDDGDVDLEQTVTFGLSYTPPSTLTFATPPAIDNTTGNLTYTPNANAFGSVIISVILSDDGGTENSGIDQSLAQQFTLTINPINDVPTLDDITGTFSVNEDAAAFNVDLTGITAGPANESQTITVEASVPNNQVIQNPGVIYSSANTSGQISITPTANASGMATVTVTVKDGQATNSSVSKTFNVTVNPVNDPPTLNPITNPDDINEDATTQTIDLDGITAGPGESQVLEVSASSNNQALIPNGNINVIYTTPNTIGSINYQPLANQSGDAEITVTVTDDATTNKTIEQKFTVTVLPVNDPPTLADLPATPIEINEDAIEQTLTLTGITAGGGESQTLNITATSDKPGIIPNPSVGTISNGEADLKYTPATNQYGLVTITVTVDDGQAQNNTVIKSFQVNVNSVNDVPTMNAITGTPFTINEDATTQIITLEGITPGGGESQTLNIYAVSEDETIIKNPTISYIQGETTANLTYTPEADQSGSVDIEVFVDDLVGSNSVTSRIFTVNVQEVNDFPTINDIISPGDILEDASEQTVALGGISGGGGEGQTVEVTAQEEVGKDIIDQITVNYSGNNNATIKFTLQPNANGATSIDVTVDDKQSVNNTTTKSFNINVVKVNDLPTLDVIPSPYNIAEDAGLQTIGLTGISPGPNESEQTVTISASSDNTDLIPNPTIINKTADTKDLVFTPKPNVNGQATITVSAYDGQALNHTIIREFVVNVSPVNDVPTFDLQSDINITENAGYQSIPGYAFNIDDGDPELTQTLSFDLDITGALSFKTLPTLSPANGTLTFETAENSNGQASITVTLHDQGTPPMLSASQTFYINVLPINGKPSFTLNGTPPTTLEDAGLIVEPAFAQNIDDGDPELDQSGSLSFDLTFLNTTIIYTVPPTIDPISGDLSYQAAANSYGTSFISVVLSDATESSTTKYFTITIDPVNDAPIGSNETVATNEDVPYTFKVSDFTYSDAEANPFNGIQIVGLESVGDLEYNGTDVVLNQEYSDVTRLVYKSVLNGNGNGYANFDYKLRDSEGKLSTTYTMTIDVNPVDDIPMSSAGEVNTQENITYTFQQTDFPFTDPDGDSFSAVRIYSVETRGDLEYQNSDVTVGTEITNFNQFKFIPVTSENGNPYATFQFEVKDSKGDYSTEYTMSIVVGPVNDRPTGANESISLLEDDIYTFSTGDFTFNDLDGHDFDGIRIETLETNGDLEYNGSDITNTQTLCPDVSLLTFQPDANENGTGYATFTFKVKDNSNTFNLSSLDYTMTINVTSVNDRPIFTISGNPPVINEDLGLQTIPDFATSLNDGDPEVGVDQTLSFNTPALVSSTGSLSFTTAPSINNTGTLTYQAAPNAFGTATYSVTLSDNGGTANSGLNTSNPQNFKITVTGINDLPTIQPIDDKPAINEDAGEQIIAIANITAGPLEDQELSVTVASSNTDLIPTPTVEYTSPATTGTIKYTPKLDQYGQSTITITVSDGGASNYFIEEEFLVTVSPVNDPPTLNAVADQGPFPENSGERIIDLDGITAGGGEDQELLVSVSSSNTTLIPTPGLTYLGNSTAQLVYTPTENENGESTITVTVDDQNGETTDMQFTITISPVNDPPTLNPIAKPDAIAEDSGEQLITLTGITPGLNEDQELTITLESSNTDLLSNLTVDYTYPDNSAILFYTPSDNEFGTSIITVTVDDGSLLDNLVSEQFTVEVLPVPDTPVVTGASTDQGNQSTTGLVIDRNANDGAEVTYFKITNIQNGNLYLQDGSTEIIEGEFILYEQGILGLRFTPNSATDGSFDIQASLEDADSGLGGGIATANIFINSIPTTSNLPDLLSLNEDSPQINFDLYQYFDDNEDLDMDLDFTVNNTATDILDVQIVGQQLTISFIENQTGVVFITVRCTDSKGAFVDDEMQITVVPVNDAPVFESEPVTTGNQDELYEYQIITSDIEGDDRYFELDAPSWLSVNDNNDGTATLTGTPTNDNLGNIDVIISIVESLSGLTTSQEFTITINNVNDTPRFVSSPPLEVLETQNYVYNVEIEDPDPNDTYAVILDRSGLPSWFAFPDEPPYILEVFPPIGSAGIYNIKLIVWDGAGASDEQIFSITVKAPNTPPTITGGFTPTINEDESLAFAFDDFDNRVEDPDATDELVSIIISELPSNGTLTLNGVSVNLNDTIAASNISNLQYVPVDNFAGQDLIIWKAFDGKIASNGEGFINITINSVEDAPEIINIEANSITYEFGDYNVLITEMAEVIEADDGRIALARFTISTNYNRAQDSLAIDVFDGIETEWNDTTGVLKVSGIKSALIYQDIVRSLIYINQKRFAPSTQTRTIELVVSDGGLESDPVIRQIEFEDTFIDLFIPTGFTPNQDMMNDTWEIDHIQSHEDAIVRVFSRAGTLIYESIGFYEEWDGKYNGKVVKPGVYYYTIEIQKFERKYSGSITILR